MSDELEVSLELDWSVRGYDENSGKVYPMLDWLVGIDD